MRCATRCWGLSPVACSHTAPARSKQSVLLLPSHCAFICILPSLGWHMDALEWRGLGPTQPWPSIWAVLAGALSRLPKPKFGVTRGRD